MDSSVEIKVKIKIGDAEIELTKDKIIELKEILEEIYPNKKDVPKVIIREKEYVPYYPVNPIDPYRWKHWDLTTDDFSPVDQPSITICMVN